MRFTRFPKCDRGTASPQRLAAARRAVERDRYRCGLFPEMMKFRDAEQRVAAILNHRVTWWQEMRDIHAAGWRRARKAVRKLPEITKRGLMIYWQTCTYPGSPEYLNSMVHDVIAKHVSWWHRLADRRRLQLVGAGKMEAPWKRTSSNPKGEAGDERWVPSSALAAASSPQAKP